MNEQAVALYQYALEFAYETVGKEDSDKPYFQAIVAGKFAELIVKECINQVSDLMDYSEYTDSHSNAVELKALREARQAIKEHFGIK